MLFNLIGTIATGIAAAGTLMLIAKVTRRRLPRWLLPAAAGFAMLGFHLWNEYTWFDRVVSALPDHVVVAEHYTYESVLQPWTLLRPRINRFLAIDRTTIRRNDQAPGYVMADILLVGRLNPTAKVTQLYDCRAGRRTDIGPKTAVDERGVPVDTIWINATRDGILFQLICNGA